MSKQLQRLYSEKLCFYLHQINSCLLGIKAIVSDGLDSEKDIGGALILSDFAGKKYCGYDELQKQPNLFKGHMTFLQKLSAPNNLAGILDSGAAKEDASAIIREGVADLHNILESISWNCKITAPLQNGAGYVVMSAEKIRAEQDMGHLLDALNFNLKQRQDYFEKWKLKYGGPPSDRAPLEVKLAYKTARTVFLFYVPALVTGDMEFEELEKTTSDIFEKVCSHLEKENLVLRNGNLHMVCRAKKSEIIESAGNCIADALTRN